MSEPAVGDSLGHRRRPSRAMYYREQKRWKHVLASISRCHSLRTALIRGIAYSSLRALALPSEPDAARGQPDRFDRWPLATTSLRPAIVPPGRKCGWANTQTASYCRVINLVAPIPLPLPARPPRPPSNHATESTAPWLSSDYVFAASAGELTRAYAEIGGSLGSSSSSPSST